MTLPHPTVFLVDVDNTLLDNDRIQQDLKDHLDQRFGVDSRKRYWTILEGLFAELGYRDYIGALQRFRVEHPREVELLSMSSFLMDYPFADRLFPAALEVLKRLHSMGPTVILSDGDVVFQPRKVEHAGIFDAVDGHVLIYIHKEEALDDVERRYPAEHYVFVDDKLRILAAVKQYWGERVTTVFPRQGTFAHDPKVVGAFPPADLSIERIAGLLDYDPRRLRLASRLKPRLKTRLTIETQAEGDAMKPTGKLHGVGQSLWLDNITRELLNSDTLKRFIDELSVTGLTSNPTIFAHAIKNSATYDEDIARKAPSARSGEDVFFGLALDDLTRAAELFQPVFARTDGVDGWVSLEVSPLLAHDTNSTLAAARDLHRRAGKSNLFIKIPGTPEGLPAIEAAIFAGVPVNVTLLFSREQYGAAAEAYLRGVERRIEAGLNPAVASVASLFVSRWDVAVGGRVPGELTNRLGIAVAQRAYKAYRELLASARFQRSANAGARAQRLLWASTGTKDPKASDIFYVKALAAPFTVNTMPEGTLKAFGDHGEVGDTLAPDGGDCEKVLASFAKAGIDIDALAARLQDEGASSFVKSWNDLMACIDSKSATIRKAS